jgi:cell division septation protein DedD
MFSKTPPRLGPPTEVPPGFHRKVGGRPARRKPPREAVAAEGLAAVATGAAVFLALASAAMMVKDSHWRSSAVPVPELAEPPPATAAPPSEPPQAIEPRFAADPQEQPAVQEEGKAQGEDKPYPAPVAPSVDLLGPAPADMRFAVYLASFSSLEQAEAGWQVLERRYRRPLSGLNPLVRPGKSREGTLVYELFAGPFDSLLDATQRCAALTIATANCKPIDLSQTGEGQ